MADLDMGKQVGPLPLGAWIAVVGGGLGIGYLYNRNRAPAATPEDEDTTPVDESGTGPGWTAVVPPGEAPPSTDTKPTTNEEWLILAIDGMIARGYPSGIVNSALNKAIMGGTDIEGNKMSAQEWTIWNLALKFYGSPPEPVSVQPPVSVPGPVIPPPVLPKPKPPPSAPPSTGIPPYWDYVVKSGDTLWSIAVKYYGDGRKWTRIRDFNLRYRSAATRALLIARGWNTSHPTIYSGSHVWVPK